jgi:hypothetical protein
MFQVDHSAKVTRSPGNSILGNLYTAFALLTASWQAEYNALLLFLNGNASLSFFATVGEESEAEVALV